jgi:hypothetical protein
MRKAFALTIPAVFALSACSAAPAYGTVHVVHHHTVVHHVVARHRPVPHYWTVTKRVRIAAHKR